MPVPPYTWQARDWLSATLLNSELYGIGFTPNGIGYHGARPIYASTIRFQPFGPALTSGVWAALGQNASAWGGNVYVKADSGALFGSRMDPGQNGTISLKLPNSGGAKGVSGGLGLMSAFVPVQAGAGTVRAGIGNSGNSGPTSTGVSTQGHSTNNVAPWALDIVDLAGTPSALTGFVLSTQTSPILAANTLDGSGRATRMGAHWLSVYPANGSQVTSIPTPRASWDGTVSLSASIMNGNQGIVPWAKLLNMPPLLRVQGSTTTSVPSNTTTVVDLPAATYDTYGGWNASTDTYTCQLSGVYLVAGFTPYDSLGTNTTNKTGVQVNGSAIWGPRQQTATGAVSASGKVGMFDLNAGDTVRLVTAQGSGSTQSTSSTSNPLLVVVYLTAQGYPVPLPTAKPNTTFGYAAGTPGATVLSQFNSRLSPDMLFLNQRPYCLTYQNFQQTYPANTDFQVQNNIQKGLANGTNGDPWNAYDLTNRRFVAPVQGWYLCVQETFFTQPNLTTGTAYAKFQASVQGNNTQDVYGASNLPSATDGGGASALGYYFLRQGDWIQPMANQSDGTSSLQTEIGTGVQSHFSACWLGE